MPSRNRGREAAKSRLRAESETDGSTAETTKKRRSNKATAGKQKRGGAKKPRSSSPSGRRPRTGPMLDPSADKDAITRFVMPGDAVKTYLCPGCNREIASGVGHIVAVPPDAPDLRRHWHRGCWDNRNTRF